MSEPPESSPLLRRSTLGELLDRVPAVAELRRHPATRLLLAGVAIGVVAGVAAGALDWGIVTLSRVFLGFAEPSVHAPSMWARILSPTLTGAVATMAVFATTRRHRPQGIPDVLARVQTHEHRLSLRDACVSAAGAVLAVGAGQSGGREGPIVQLASTLAAKVVRALGVAPQHARALVAAGAAAGVAASFNTPLPAPSSRWRSSSATSRWRPSRP